MKPNIVFLDEYTLGGADLTRLHELGRYTGYSTTAPDEVADRCRAFMKHSVDNRG